MDKGGCPVHLGTNIHGSRTTDQDLGPWTTVQSSSELVQRSFAARIRIMDHGSWIKIHH